MTAAMLPRAVSTLLLAIADAAHAPGPKRAPWHSASVHLALASALCCLGCTFDARAPTDGSVHCGEDGLCPAELRCIASIGRCLPEGADRDAPSILSSSTSAAVLRRGQRLVVSVTVSEPLAVPPTVRLAQGGRVRALEQDAAAAQPPQFSFETTIGGDDAEGSARVVADLADLFGNQALGLNVASVSLDFTPPRVVPTTLELRLLPPPGCPLREVSALGVGASAQLRFSVDEPVAGAPRVSTDGASPATWSLESSTGTSFVFSLRADAGVVDGPLGLQLEVADQVGNVLREPLDAGFVVDRRAPPPPPVGRPDAVIHHRAPWGRLDGGLAFFVEAAPGALEPGTLLRVVDPATQALLGEGRASADGGAVAELVPLDRPRVQVSSVDDACNVSAPGDVKDVTWVATHAGRTPGATFPNPHAAHAQRWWAGADSLLAATEPFSGDDLARGDGRALRVTGALSWSPALTTTRPAIGFGGAAAWDPLRENVLLFGGTISGGQSGNLWQWNGRAWIRRTPLSTQPLGTALNAGAYDSRRHRFVFPGGSTTAGNTAALHEWDGQDFRRRTSTGAAPSARTSYGMAYDPVRGVSVMFGGLINGTLTNEVWLWDGVRWTQPALSSPWPSARQQHTLVWDPVRERVVAFGGLTLAGPSDELWEWDGARWALRVVPGPTPSARAGHAATYDTARQRLVLFGGGTPMTGFSWTMFGDVWELSSTGWQDRTPAAGPDPRLFANLVYDPKRARSVMFLGRQHLQPGCSATPGLLTTCFDDLWEWDGTQWENRTPLIAGSATAALPRPRTLTAMAMDTGRGRAYLFGGVGAAGVSTELWWWDGAQWSFADAGVTPPGRNSHGFAFDSARERLVLFGGRQGQFPPATFAPADTWEYGDATGWTLAWPADGGPSAREWPCLTFHEATGQTVLVGGSIGESDTRTLDDGGWRLRATGPPGPAIQLGSMVYDSARQVAVLWDRTNVWEWSGTAWRAPVTVEPKPAGRGQATLVYDALRGRTVMYWAGFGALDDDQLWEWDGVRWDNVSPPAPRPGGRVDAVGAYDARRRALIVFGGVQTNGGGATNETWELTVEGKARPALEARFSFLAASAEAGAELRDATVRAIAGADGVELAQPVSGAALWLWSSLAFAVAVQHAGPAATPAPLAVTVSDAFELQRLFTGGGQELRLAITPVGRNGARPAEVVVDALELTVRYRRP